VRRYRPAGLAEGRVASDRHLQVHQDRLEILTARERHLFRTTRCFHTVIDHWYSIASMHGAMPVLVNHQDALVVCAGVIPLLALLEPAPAPPEPCDLPFK
jgi:hypothetical protein